MTAQNDKTDDYQLGMNDEARSAQSGIYGWLLIIIAVAFLIFSCSPSPSSSSGSATCPICGRETSQQQITRQGMCSSCYSNYKTAQDVKDSWGNRIPHPHETAAHTLCDRCLAGGRYSMARHIAAILLTEQVPLIH